MPQTPKKNTGSSAESLWNKRNRFERVKMIHDYPESFIESGLLTRDEVDRLMRTDETEWEYIVDRNPEILFDNIDITDTVRHQEDSKKMRAAMKAVLFESK